MEKSAVSVSPHPSLIPAQFANPAFLNPKFSITLKRNFDCPLQCAAGIAKCVRSNQPETRGRRDCRARSAKDRVIERVERFELEFQRQALLDRK